jgi:hypothetical protein
MKSANRKLHWMGLTLGLLVAMLLVTPRPAHAQDMGGDPFVDASRANCSNVKTVVNNDWFWWFKWASCYGEAICPIFYNPTINSPDIRKVWGDPSTKHFRCKRTSVVHYAKTSVSEDDTWLNADWYITVVLKDGGLAYIVWKHSQEGCAAIPHMGFVHDWNPRLCNL